MYSGIHPNYRGSKFALFVSLLHLRVSHRNKRFQLNVIDRIVMKFAIFVEIVGHYFGCMLLFVNFIFEFLTEMNIFNKR